MIKLRNWKVFIPSSDQMLGYEGDHLLRRLEIETDIDDSWAVMLDLEKDGQKNVISLDLDDGILSAELTRDMLRTDGTYTAQLRGSCGDIVAHSNQFHLVVYGSINAVDAFPETGPSYMEALEKRLLALKIETEQSANTAEAAANSVEESTEAAQIAADRAEAARGSIVLDEQKMAQAVQDAAGSAGAASNQADRAKTEADRAEAEADEAEEWAAKAQEYAEIASTPAVAGVYNIVLTDRVTAQRYALIVENGVLVLLGVSAALDATEPVRIDTVTGTAYYIAVEDGVIVLNPVEEG